MTDYLAQYEAELPETAQEIIAVIGLSDTLKLVKKYGGNMLLIPKVKHNGNAIAHLVDAIGEASAFKLVEHFRGTTLYLPKCEAALRKHRNDSFFRAVDAYITEHKTSQDQAFFALCPSFGITYRTAFYIMKRRKMEKKLKQITQARLF